MTMSKPRRNSVAAFIAALGIVLTLATAAPAVGKPRKSKKPPSEPTMPLAALVQRVAALEALDTYDFTPAQVAALRKASAEATAALAKSPPLPVAKEPKPSKDLDAYRKALSELADALADPDRDDADDAKLEELRNRAEGLADQVAVDPPPQVGPPDVARRAALDLARQLKASQVAAALAEDADVIADPADLALDAAEAKKALREQKAWPAVRDEAATEVAFLVAGWDAAAAKPVAERVGKWLESCPDLDGTAFAAAKAGLEADARKVVGPVDGWAVARHWVERDLAELLCNPQLSQAIDARHEE
jgi:hypothetical protein